MKVMLAWALGFWLLPHLFAQTTSDYTTTVHVKHSHFTVDAQQLTQRLDVTIDGHDYELAGNPLSAGIFTSALLIPGDYPAKITKDEHKTPYKLTRIYELKFPDGKTDKFIVIGMSQ